MIGAWPQSSNPSDLPLAPVRTLDLFAALLDLRHREQVANLPVSDRGKSPTHVWPSFHTPAPAQSASVILLVLKRVALPKLPPRSLITSHAASHVSLPLASLRLRRSAQTISC